VGKLPKEFYDTNTSLSTLILALLSKDPTKRPNSKQISSDLRNSKDVHDRELFGEIYQGKINYKRENSNLWVNKFIKI